MKRTSLIACVVLASAALGGCKAQTEREARLLIVPVRWTGQAMEVCTGGSERLVEAGRISGHRRVKVDDGVEIDTWVIKSRLHDPEADNKGGFFETKITRGTVVLLHPLMTGKSWFLRLGEKLADRGWDVVLMDARGHGFSGGRYVTWGAREKKDVKAVLDKLLATEPISDRIYVCGSSLGGGVAIQYAAIDPRCKGVIALSPPAGPVDVFRRMLWLLPESNFAAALKRARELAEFDPADASAVTAAHELSCPVIIVRGALDLLTPRSHSEAIYDATEAPKKLVTVRTAGHIVEIGRDSWLADQMDALAAMKGETPPQVITMRVARAD